MTRIRRTAYDRFEARAPGAGDWFNSMLKLINGRDDFVRESLEGLASVNGMGGTPLSELFVVYRKVAEVCRRRGFEIVRNLVGCSITLLRVDEEMVRLWDAPVFTPAIRWGL